MPKVGFKHLLFIVKFHQITVNGNFLVLFLIIIGKGDEKIKSVNKAATAMQETMCTTDNLTKWCYPIPHPYVCCGVPVVCVPWVHVYVCVSKMYMCVSKMYICIHENICMCESKMYICINPCVHLCVFLRYTCVCIQMYLSLCVYQRYIYVCLCVVYKIILFKLTWVNILPELFWSNVVSEFNNFAQVRNVAHGPFVSSPTYLSIRFYVKYLVFKHSSFILILVLFLYKSYMKFVVVNAWEQM